MTGLLGPDTEAALMAACTPARRREPKGLPAMAEFDEFDEFDPEADGARPQAAPSASPAGIRGARCIDVQRAALLNRRSSIELRWVDYASSIRNLLGLSTRAPSEAEFVRAVAAWQARQGGLRTDGVVDRATLAAMRPERVASDFNGLDPRHALDATPGNTLLTQLLTAGSNALHLTTDGIRFDIPDTNRQQWHMRFANFTYCVREFK